MINKEDFSDYNYSKISLKMRCVTKESVKNIEGGYTVRTTSEKKNFKDFSRIFQGQITVFKD